MDHKKNYNEQIILITGAAGFIGAALSQYLLKNGAYVIGLDNLNDYYDINLKKERINQIENSILNSNGKWKFYKDSLENFYSLEKLFDENKPSIVVNLAAQAGVRYSIENPQAYIQSNLVGFSNLIELCRNYGIEHFIYASSSSVYGGNVKMPFSEKMSVDHPVSLYGATKRANELIAHSYSSLYSLPSTGLRFFTVYGPWGRPDMALFLFTKAIIDGKPIKVFNNGEMIRDFTYIDDIIISLDKLINKPPIQNKSFDYLNPNPDESWAPHAIYNIGNSCPIPLLKYVEELEKALGINAFKEYLPMQSGDVKATFSDTSKLEKFINYKPKTSIKSGISKFVRWYRNYYKV
nr:NAD-dependent epimerase/dehydratase family protein [Prochlorococcus marinus]